MSPFDWEVFDSFPEPIRRVLADASVPYDLDANLKAAINKGHQAGMTDEEIAGRLEASFKAHGAAFWRQVLTDASRRVDANSLGT